MAEHLGKRKRRSSSPARADDRSTETEAIHPSSRIIKRQSRSTEPRHGASPLQSSREGRPKTPVENTTGHGSLTTQSRVGLSSPAATIDEVTTPQEIFTSEGFTVTPRNTSHPTEQPEVNSNVPYALTWTEHDLELKDVKAQENSGSKSGSNSRDISSTADDDRGHITHGVFPRHEHSCTAIPNSDGEFIIFGGLVQDGDKKIRTNDVLLLSTTNMSLTSLETTGTKPEVRTSHTAVIAGRVLVVFGGTRQDSYLHFLKLDTREWSKFRPPAPYPLPRFGHSFIIVDNTIWLYGGLSVQQDDSMWCLDLGNDGIEQVRWRRIPKKDPWPQTRSYHSTVYYDGSLYLFGGVTLQETLKGIKGWLVNDVWRFEISAETWTKVQYHGQAPQPRSGHTATVISDNMFIFGGMEETAEGPAEPTDDAFVFNLRDHTWWSLAMLGRTPPPAQGGVMSTLGSRLVLVGGESGKGKPVYIADTRAARYVRDSLAKLEFTTETNQLKFTTEVVDLSRFVRKQGDAAHSLAGFSDVWKGELTETGKPIAIKVLRVASTGNPDDPQSGRLRTRFDRELTIWMECQHPRVLELLGYAYIEGIPCLISPWCENGNIMEYLKKNPNENRLQMVIQVAEGLVYLHGRDPPVIHSDVKPANVLINESGDAKICDFGISKLMMDTPSGFTTTKGANFTLRYSAKELLCAGENSMMSDVFAFGMLVLEVVTNKHPFFKISLEPMIVMAIMNDETPSPEDYPELPAANPLWDIMKECWDAEPTKRPTMVEVLDKLPRTEQL